ncbi:MAG TPA: S8 family serine peptidase [Blastocatellia bacterium]|nr:S8 family serine peptidase [Blastocatellia bacterium]
MNTNRKHLAHKLTSGLLIAALFVAAVSVAPRTHGGNSNDITMWLPSDVLQEGDALILQGTQRFNDGQMRNLSFFIGPQGVDPERIDPDTVRVVVPALEAGTYAVRVVKHASDPGRDIEEFSGDIVIGRRSALALDSGAGSLTFEVGSARNAVTIVNLLAGGGGAVTVSTSVYPDDGGLGMFSNYPPGGYSAAGPFSFVLDQSFTGNRPGKYVVTNTATLHGTTPATTVSDTTVVTVLPPGGDPIIFRPCANPSGVHPGVLTPVTFNLVIAQFKVAPDEVSLLRVDGEASSVAGTLRDDGNDGDLQANDGIYSGTVFVNAPEEGKLLFKASAAFPGVSQERVSDALALVVTSLPITLAASDYSKVVDDRETGRSFLSNEVVAEFSDEVSSARRREIAAVIGGTIVGTDPTLGSHQIRFPGTGKAAGVYAAISQLENQPGVISARPNAVGVQTAEVTPEDPGYGPFQQALRIVRADEAWVVTRGHEFTPVAVVDTGVNYNHEDLAGKVIKGRDVVSNDDDPMEVFKNQKGHGTMVAGVIGAITDNDKGGAGLTWGCKVIAIRAANKEPKSTTVESFASGIVAAANAGARIINLSGGKETNDKKEIKVLKDAVDYAVGGDRLVVSVPGNIRQLSRHNVRVYPGAFDNVLCVTATTNSDGRSSLSNAADYVDIGAPGEDIYSTTLNGDYDTGSGTSFAAPIVSAAAALVWSRNPAWKASEVRKQLEDTASRRTGITIGKGRVDIFEAVFNGMFENGKVEPSMAPWSVIGTAGAIEMLGSIKPVGGEGRMCHISSGPEDRAVESIVQQSFVIPEGVESIPIEFQYNFVTEEYPEWVGRGFNDDMTIVLVTPSGQEEVLAFESVDGSTFMPAERVNFNGGDDTAGQTGWKTVRKTVAVTGGPGTYRIVVRDRGDGIFDSEVLIDNIRFKFNPAP